jgi:hypothetical protein
MASVSTPQYFSGAAPVRWKQKKSFDDRRIDGDTSVLSLVVRVFKREVRAFGGCLGMKDVARCDKLW